MFMQNSYTLYTVYYHIVNVHCIDTLKKKKKLGKKLTIM